MPVIAISTSGASYREFQRSLDQACELANDLGKGYIVRTALQPLGYRYEAVQSPEAHAHITQPGIGPPYAFETVLYVEKRDEGPLFSPCSPCVVVRGLGELVVVKLDENAVNFESGRTNSAKVEEGEGEAGEESDDYDGDDDYDDDGDSDDYTDSEDEDEDEDEVEYYGGSYDGEILARLHTPTLISGDGEGLYDWDTDTGELRNSNPNTGNVDEDLAQLDNSAVTSGDEEGLFDWDTDTGELRTSDRHTGASSEHTQGQSLDHAAPEGQSLEFSVERIDPSKPGWVEMMDLEVEKVRASMTDQEYRDYCMNLEDAECDGYEDYLWQRDAVRLLYSDDPAYAAEARDRARRQRETAAEEKAEVELCAKNGLASPPAWEFDPYREDRSLALDGAVNLGRQVQWLIDRDEIVQRDFWQRTRLDPEDVDYRGRRSNDLHKLTVMYHGVVQAFHEKWRLKEYLHEHLRLSVLRDELRKIRARRAFFGWYPWGKRH